MAADQVNLSTLVAGVATETAFETEKVSGKHRPVHAVRDGGDETQGAKADAAATTDTGTFSLLALVKRLLSVGLWVRGNTYTDFSISSATGASQTLRAANAAARKRQFVNNGNTIWTIHPTGGTAVSGGTGCFDLYPRDSWLTDSQNQITGIATAGSKLTILEA